jgi:mono/diheme cytochrome c family protein
MKGVLPVGSWALANGAPNLEQGISGRLPQQEAAVSPGGCARCHGPSQEPVFALSTGCQ